MNTPILGAYDLAGPIVRYGKWSLSEFLFIHFLNMFFFTKTQCVVVCCLFDLYIRSNISFVQINLWNVYSDNDRIKSLQVK